ncbi:MAG: chemotaxis protein CheW [Pseudomonadota bacterium]
MHAVQTSTPVRQDRPLECLTFRLGTEEYGIDILGVQEIRGYERPTRIAGAPAFVKGVVNLRGVIVPVIDLRLRFGTADAAHDSVTATVIVNLADRMFGVVVDAVSDVVILGSEQIKPVPALGGAVDVEFITGLGTLGLGDQQRMLILLDIERLMAGAAMGLGRSLH